MKRMFALFLTLAFAISALTACGCTATQEKPDSNASENNTVTGDTVPGASENLPTTIPDNGTDSPYDDNIGNDGGMDNNPDTAPGNGDSILDDAGNAIENGINDVENALDSTDSAARNRARETSYDQMVKNARVHDKDGNLKDHENATSKQFF